VERSRLSVYFLYLAWRLWKSVVTLAVNRNSIQSRVFRRQRILVFQRQRLPLTGSRWHLRWVIGRRTKPTFCVSPVFSMAVMAKCCNSCGDREYYFSSCFSASEGAVFQGHRLPFTGSRWDIRWLIGRRTKPILCVFFFVFPSICMAVMAKCCDACGDKDFYFRSGFSASEGADV
jgi:hypothetical protein